MRREGRVIRVLWIWVHCSLFLCA